jgi:hypothetical protein
MPKEGPAYTITPEWQERVRVRMVELKITKKNGEPNFAELTRRVGCGRTAMWQMMQPGAVETGWMPEVHKVLKWDPPVNSNDQFEAELIAAFRRLPDVDKGRELERMRQKAEQRAATRRKAP